jgi:hypothetical protein
VDVIRRAWRVIRWHLYDAYDPDAHGKFLRWRELIYAPRDAHEIEVVAGLVDEAYRYASGVVPDVG